MNYSSSHEGDVYALYSSSQDPDDVYIKGKARVRDFETPRCNRLSHSKSGPARSFSASWLPTFRRWLPQYLDEVYRRLKEGEVYPLSALKGDFRANCGLDMDQSSLGYSKLSEFIKSVPELCRMKVAVVGNGPATHSILLPALRRKTLPVSSKFKNNQTRRYPEKVTHILAPAVGRPGTSYWAGDGGTVYYQREKVLPVYCVFCRTWSVHEFIVGQPCSPFGICSVCKENAAMRGEQEQRRCQEAELIIEDYEDVIRSNGASFEVQAST